MASLLPLVMLVLGGCNWVLGLSQVDPPTGRRLDGMSDALFEDCRGKIVFSDAPLLFPGFNEVSTPTIRSDLQEAYDVENDLNGTNIHHWILGSNQMFGPVDDLSVLNTGSEDDPSLTADGLEIAFVSTRQGKSNPYLAERETVDALWGSPVLMPGLEGYIAESVALSADGLTLYAADGTGDMLQAERTDRRLPFAAGAVVANNVAYPTVSADGLELISQSTTNSGLFEQIRDNNKLTPFGNVTQVDLSGTPKQPELSRDNHILLTAAQHYFTRSCQ